MKEITLNAPRQVLKVNIGEDSFSIPLGSELPFDEVMKMSSAKGKERTDMMFKLLQDNIPEEIYKKLTMGDVTQIFRAWNEATQEATGASLGEL